MKQITYIIIVCSLWACNNQFLEKSPVENSTQNDAFVTYNNFKTYSWGLYNVFNNENILHKPGTTSENGYYLGDVYAGYLSQKNVNYQNAYAFQQATVPSSGGGWNFDYIRKVNLMLANIDQAKMTQTEKDHWKAVGYFFRAFYYCELIARFGDVPWIDKVLTETDTEIIYGKRTPRDIVAKNILDQLLWAETNIKTEGDGKNTINVHCVRALISRFGLFEGTWIKYHNLSKNNLYLNECIRTSNLLMQKHSELHSHYDELFTSPDLGVIKGSILYKEFIASVLTSNQGYYERTSSNFNQMNKATVELFLCVDGKTISNSPLYSGDQSLYDEMRNRDPRLLLNVAPPYRVKVDGQPTGSAQDEEYIIKMKNITRPGHKQLPLYNWGGTLLHTIPNVEPKPNQVFLACRTGYYMYKHYNAWDVNSNLQALNTADKPIFKIEEILLNLVEAKYELGEIDQTVIDQTINKLRARQNVNIKPLVIDQINNSFDPKRDPSVDPLLWEIRRERIVELMGEGFGFYDVRRWKKAEWFVNKQVKGIYIRKTDANMAGKQIMDPITLKPNDQLTEGYLYVSPDPVQQGLGWQPKHYLYPIPSNQFLLNPNLGGNNPGWGKF